MASSDSVGSIGVGSEECDVHICDTCKLDGLTIQAIIFCLECEEKLCKNCEIWHQKIKSSRGHNVKPVAEMSDYTLETDMYAKPFKALCSCSRKKDVSDYCKDHHELVCSLCCNIKHRTCQVSSVDKLSHEESAIKGFKDMYDSTNKLMSEAAKIKDIHANIRKELDDIAETCRHEIRELKMSFNTWIDQLEERALHELEQEISKRSSNLENEELTVGSTLELLEADRQLVESANKSQNKNQMFITTTKIQTGLETYETVLHDILTKQRTPRISFEINKDLINLKQSIDRLGQIMTNDCLPEALPTGFLNAKIKSINKVNIKHAKDNRNPCITGITLLPNNEVIICDYYNKRLDLLDENFNIRNSLTYTDQPWNVAVVSDEEALVTFSSPSFLRFVFFLPNLKSGKTIQIEGTVNGTAVVGNHIYLSDNKSDMLYMIDKNGNILRTIDGNVLWSKESRFKEPTHMSSNNAENKLFVSYVDSNNIVCLSLDYRLLFSYSDSDMKYPRAIVTDEHDNIMVACQGSNNIHVVRADGTQHKILLTADEGLEEPIGMCFRPSDGVLIIGGRDMCDIFVIRLQI